MVTSLFTVDLWLLLNWLRMLLQNKRITVFYLFAPFLHLWHIVCCVCCAPCITSVHVLSICIEAYGKNPYSLHVLIHIARALCLFLNHIIYPTKKLSSDAKLAVKVKAGVATCCGGLWCLEWMLRHGDNRYKFRFGVGREKGGKV